MFWTIFLLFLTVVSAILGFLGLGFGQIEIAKMSFYVLLPLLLFAYFLERRKRRKNYFD